LVELLLKLCLEFFFGLLSFFALWLGCLFGISFLLLEQVLVLMAHAEQVLVFTSAKHF
jgi:hypothetical protein